MSPAFIPPLAAVLIPMIPGLVDQIIRWIEAVTADPGTPEETRVKLTALVAELRVLNAEIQAAPLPGDEVPPA